MTTSDLTPSSPRFLAAVAKMEEVEKLHPHAPLDALLLAAIPVLLDEPTSGDHDELLARTATHRSDGVGGGVALIRELETALRTEQSARQAAEAERDALREVVVAAPGYMSQDRAEQFHQDRGVPNPYRWQRESRYYDGRLVVALSERDALQARIDTALAVKPNPYGGNTGEIGMRAALTESKEPEHEQ
jgi:hypothetical protein